MNGSYSAALARPSTRCGRTCAQGWLALFGAITERLPHRNERTGQLQFLEPEEAREIAQRELPFEDLNPGLLQVS